MPTNSNFGNSSFRALISRPPSRSPEISPATIPIFMGRLSNNAARARAQEIGQYFQLRLGGCLGRQRGPGFCKCQPGTVQGLVGTFYRGDLFRREAPAVEAFGLDPDRLQGIPAASH